MESPAFSTLLKPQIDYYEDIYEQGRRLYDLHARNNADKTAYDIVKMRISEANPFENNLHALSEVVRMFRPRVKKQNEKDKDIMQFHGSIKENKNVKAHYDHLLKSARQQRQGTLQMHQ